VKIVVSNDMDYHGYNKLKSAEKLEMCASQVFDEICSNQ